jgi:hypothetical protein
MRIKAPGLHRMLQESLSLAGGNASAHAIKLRREGPRAGHLRRRVQVRGRRGGLRRQLDAAVTGCLRQARRRDGMPRRAALLGRGQGQSVATARCFEEEWGPELLRLRQSDANWGGFRASTAGSGRVSRASCRSPTLGEDYCTSTAGRGRVSRASFRSPTLSADYCTSTAVRGRVSWASFRSQTLGADYCTVFLRVQVLCCTEQASGPSRNERNSMSRTIFWHCVVLLYCTVYAIALQQQQPVTLMLAHRTVSISLMEPWTISCFISRRMSRRSTTNRGLVHHSIHVLYRKLVACQFSCTEIC